MWIFINIFKKKYEIHFKKIALNYVYFIEKQLRFRINNNQNESDSSQQTLYIFRNIIYLDKLTIWICTFLKYMSVISSYKDYWHDNDNGDTWHHNSEITLTLTLCCLCAQCALQLTQEARLLQHLVNLSHSTQQTRAHSHSLQFMNWKNFKLFNKWHNVLHKVLKFSPPLATVIIALVTWFSAKTNGNECI